MGQGKIGNTGPLGPKGEIGDKGDKGDSGSSTGIKGDKGDSGIKGDKGDSGIKGDKGDSGIKGDTGPPGGAGPLGVMTPLADAPMYFRNVGDTNHGIGYSNNKGIDGASIWGNLGGGLGTVSNRDSITWNNKGDMNIGGGAIVNNNANPIKFSSKWSGFEGLAKNNSEISNDTTDFKSLMLLGNTSAENGRQVKVWDDLSVDRNLNVNHQVCIGPRWCIIAEGNNLSFRDNLAGGDKRVTMYPNQYTDITQDLLHGGDKITLRNNKDGVDERRVQRGDDNVMRFANNNTGNWETMTIEKR